jgi:predicted dehydrogenase
VNEGKIGFGVIGLGMISRYHVKGLVEANDCVRVAAVCDTVPGVAEKVAAEIGAKAYTDYRELLKDPMVEAVDLPLPHHLHYEVARQALEAGKHVLIEKPMAPTEKECASLIALAKSKGLAVSVAENTPFVAAYVEVERLIRIGVLGRPRLIRTFIYGSEIDRLNDTRSWKGRADGTIGGAIFDAGPHSFYLLKWLFGEIESVRAFKNKFVEISEVEDNAVVAGRMKSGAMFTTEYSFTAEIPWGERLEIYGSEGSLIVDQLYDPPVVHFQGSKDMRGHPVTSVAFDSANWKSKSIAAGAAAFACAVHRNEPPPVDPLDGQYSMRVVERAYQSILADGKAILL